MPAIAWSYSPGMDLRRVRVWEWLTGLGGAVLLVSLFLPWYSVGGADATAWESFAVVDVILAFAALCATALPVVAATQRTAAVPQAFGSTIVWVLGVAAVLALIRLVNTPGFGIDGAYFTHDASAPGRAGSLDVTRAAGVWIGTIAALAAMAFDIKSMRDKRFPSVMRPRLDIESIPAPAPDGSRRDVQ